MIPRLSPSVSVPSAFYRQSFKEDVSALCREEIRLMMLDIVGEETANQENQGNKAQLVYTDGYINKSVNDAQKKVVVIFGDTLAKQAMALVESTLAGAIAKITQQRTGVLSNIKANWTWIFLRNNAPIAFPYDAQGNLTFQAGDKLILKPTGVPYASVVNMQIVGSGKGLTKRVRTSNRGRKAKSASGVAKRYQNMGFMGATSALLKRNPVFLNYRVYVVQSKQHQVSGELNKKQGTLCLVIAPKMRRMM